MSVVRRLVLGPVVLLTLLLGIGWAAGSAVAAPCPYVAACSPSVGVTTPFIQAGATQQFVVNGMIPGDTVTLTFTDANGAVTVQTVIVDADGRATGSFTVPADSSGTVTLTAVGSQGETASTTFTVIAAPATGSTGTPTTGSSTGAGGGPTTSSGGGGPITSSGGGGGLAYTGVAVAGLGVVCVGLLVSGGLLLLLGRRRRPLAS